MNKEDLLPDKQYIFGALLIISNRLDTLLERELKCFGVTSKQWYLSMIIDTLFDNPPTLKEAAKEMGSSHQNVKQVALKLQDKDLLELVKDKKDARVTRLKMTKKSYSFWESTLPKGFEFTERVFNNIEKEDLEKARFVMKQILSNIQAMDNENVERSFEEWRP